MINRYVKGWVDMSKGVFPVPNDCFSAVIRGVGRVPSLQRRMTIISAGIYPEEYHIQRTEADSQSVSTRNLW